MAEKLGLPEGFVLDTEETATAIPDGFVLDASSKRREDTPQEVEGEEGFFSSFSDWFTGADRMTENLEQLPTIIETGFLEGSSPADVAKIAALTMVTDDQNELANIIQKTLPDVRVQYDKDAQGNIYPVLFNPKNGKTAIVDRPGTDIMNVAQFVGQLGLFAGGPTSGIAKVAATETGKEAAIQTAQTMSGGDFDAGDVVTTAATAGVMQGLGDVAGFAYRGLKGKGDEATEQILAASNQFNVPVMTSDIYNPENWFSRGAQITSEWLPVVGTGGVRHSQQQARKQAMDDFLSMYRGGTYEEVIQEVGKKSDEMRKATGAVYNKVNPYLDQLSQADGVPMPNATREMQNLTEYLTTPGLDVDASDLNLADDLDALMTGTPQSFQVLKDNISSWHERLNSIDPNSRPITSKIKARFDNVLRAARKDRDAFAQSNLNEMDYGALKQADAAWGEAVTDMGTSKLKAILDKGDVTPEVARQMMFSRNKSDVARLYKSLTPKGQDAARAAFITQIAKDLEGTQSGLSPSSLATRMNKYQEGIDTLFEGKRKDEINGFMNLMESTRRAQEIERGSGSQTFERLAGLGVLGTAASGAIPAGAFASYATLGGVSRLFESPKVRNLLIRANTMKPGSDALQQVGQEFNNILRASLQANPLKGSTEFEREMSEAMAAQQEGPELNVEGNL